MSDDMTDDPSASNTASVDDATPSAPEWWASIVDHVAAHEVDAPDPWSDVVLSSAALTVDQESFLGGFEDQPSPPHVGEPDPLAAGEQ